MIKVLRPFIAIIKQSIRPLPKPYLTTQLITTAYYASKKEHSISAALLEKIGPIKFISTTLGQQRIDLHQTAECLSLVEQLPEGETAPPQEFLLLRMSCTNCKTRVTRAFLRYAYEKGVVMIRCAHCHHYHLIADHFGWFPEGQLKEGLRPYDSVAIIRFIKQTFERGLEKQ